MCSTLYDDLPVYTKPPVCEVVLGIQFKDIKELMAPQMGLLWDQYRKEYPITRQHPALEPVLEQFSPPSHSSMVRIESFSDVPSHRCWFLNESDTMLIQVQQDRFVNNWRKREEDPDYPRYAVLREQFEKNYSTFVDFCSSISQDPVEPVQCEVTYVNHIACGEGWANHGEIGNVLTLFQNRYSDSFLTELENCRLHCKYLIPGDDGSPIGRLHVSAKPGYKEEKPMVNLTLTARGEPRGMGIEGVFAFLDIAHRWVVKGFTSVTTEKMHKLWGREK